MYAVRTQNRTNPFAQLQFKDQVFHRPGKKSDEVSLADAIQPHSFGNNFSGSFKPKRFGAFNK